MLSLRQIFSEYKAKPAALPSFNIDNFVIYQAIEAAVSQTQLPCLVQLSRGEDQFIQAERLFMLVKKAQSDGLPIYLNMDHSQDIPRLKKLLRLGFDMVHFDGSSQAIADNLTQSKDLVNYIQQTFPDAASRPLLEVEINKISLTQAGLSPENLTNPQEALDFIKTSGADLLAVSVGNLHGRPPEGVEEHLNLNLFHQITQLLPQSIFYTMHGGSGISFAELSHCIQNGVVKININTDLRQAYLQELKVQLQQQTTEKIYEYYQPVIETLTEIAKQKLLTFHNPTHV